MHERLYAPEGPLALTDDLLAAAQAALDELLAEQKFRRSALVRGFDLLPLWVVVDADHATIPSSRDPHVRYTVSAEACTCPAYAEPVAKGDPPRFCYHRGGLVIVLRALTRIRRGESPDDPSENFVPGLQVAAGEVFLPDDLRTMRQRLRILLRQ